MSIFKIKADGMIGVEENDIALIYKYGIVFLNGEELHFSPKWIKKYVEKNDYHHLYHEDVC
tara:strand:+ start:166 stop:348 length:183 start_codon:yes stop_codon:yes gene_type:complete